MPKCTEDLFLEQVKSHEMERLLDSCSLEPYRHIRFSRPNSSTCMFELITFPMHLVYAGDMGTFVFSRINDMFDFFPMDNNDFNNKGNGCISINPDYWSEKLEASPIDTGVDGYKQFSKEKFKKAIFEYYEDYLIDNNIDNEKIKEDLLYEIEENVLIADTEYEAYSFADNFSYIDDDGIMEDEFVFHDVTSWNFQEYTFHYLWACYAIQWGIAKYKEKKAELCKA